MSDVYLIKVNDDQRDLLWNILQKYLYELSQYYNFEIDNNGNIYYKYFDAYFENEACREAFLFYHNNKLIGFSMINSHSPNGEAIDHFVGEFTVFPQYRNSGLSTKAAKALFKNRKGIWQLKYSYKNQRAAKFWNKIILDYVLVDKIVCGDEVLLTFISE